MSSRRYDQCLKDEGLRCVWSDQPLNPNTLDIGHMFSWLHGRAVISGTFSLRHRRVNQRLKRDRLPSASTMSRGKARIMGWWEQAYRHE